MKKDLHEASKSTSEIRDMHCNEMLKLEGRMTSEREKILMDQEIRLKADMADSEDRLDRENLALAGQLRDAKDESEKRK